MVTQVGPRQTSWGSFLINFGRSVTALFHSSGAIGCAPWLGPCCCTFLSQGAFDVAWLVQLCPTM